MVDGCRRGVGVKARVDAVFRHGHVLADVQVGEGGDGPGVVTRLVEDVLGGPIGGEVGEGRVGGRGSLDVLGVGDDVVARGVLHGNLRGANLAAVARVEVRDGVRVRLEVISDAAGVILGDVAVVPGGIPRGSHLGRGPGGGVAVGVGPGGHEVQVLGDETRGGGAALAAEDGDGLVEVEAGVERLDLRIVPAGDFAEEDARQGARVEVDLRNAGDVVEEGDAADDEGDVEKVPAARGGSPITAIEGNVAGAEVVAVGHKVALATTGAWTLEREGVGRRVGERRSAGCRSHRGPSRELIEGNEATRRADSWAARARNAPTER